MRPGTRTGISASWRPVTDRQVRASVRSSVHLGSGDAGSRPPGRLLRDARHVPGDLGARHRLQQRARRRQRAPACRGAEDIRDELVELGSADDGPRHRALSDQVLLVGLDPVVPHRHLVAAHDRHAHMMTHPGGLLGGQQLPGALDQDRRRLPPGVVAGVHDDVAAAQRGLESGSGNQVHAVLGGGSAQHPDLVPARAQLLGDVAAQRARSSCNRDSHALVTT